MKPYYQDKWVTIYHGDCREILPTLPKVDLVLTDPPYGINWQSNWRTDTFDLIKGDNAVDGSWVNLCHANVYYCFSRWDVLQKWIDIFTSANLKVNDVLVWDKLAHGAGNLSSYAPTYELIIYASSSSVKLEGKRPQNVLRHWRVDAGATGMSSGKLLHHPAQKPDELISSILVNHVDGLILDPFLGSGTTCYCSKKLNRHSIGIEIEERYCEIAARRCSQEVFEFEYKQEDKE